MAAFLFSQVKGSSIKFNPAVDVLHFDSGSAGGIDLRVSGTTLTLWSGAEWVTLSNVSSRGQLSSANITFADGSLLLIGDNTSGVAGDSSANELRGGAGNDRLIGMSGNDLLDGAGGSDTYVILGTNDGADRFRDSGVGGVDRIVADSNNAAINLATAFSSTLTGIEEISASGYAGVRIVGGSGADVLDFSTIVLDGIASIDAMAGSDTITGGTGGDTIKGGSGNDTIDGGAGVDTAVFAGTRASYLVTDRGGYFTVQDLDTVTHGNDGTDTLRGVERLSFADAIVDLTTPPANRAPVAVNDSLSIGEDVAATSISVLANDSDPDMGDNLSVVAVNGTGLRGSVQIAAGGAGVVYSSLGAHNGLMAGATFHETFSYTIADAAGLRSTANVTVTVLGANDAPVAAPDAATVSANAGATLIAVLANDQDPDVGDTRTVVAADGDGRPGGIVITAMTNGVGVGFIDPGTPPILGSMSVTSGGQAISYDPGTAFRALRAGQSATETIFYTMADGSGAQSSSTLTVSVLGMNDAPTALADAVSVARNAAPLTINVLANDADPDAGDTRRVLSVNTAGTMGMVNIAADGSHVVYAVGSAFPNLADGTTATDTFTYTMVDGAGVASTATVTIIVTGGNTAPQAVADVAAVSENGAPITINVLGNDVDADVGDTRSVVTVNGAGLQGSVTVTPGGGSVTYAIGGAYQSLRAGQTATETFTYTMADAGAAQSTASVTVTITGINDTPVAVANSYALSEDAGPTALTVLANDTDLDAGDSKMVSAINVTGLKGSASIAADGSGVVYTPYQSLRAGQLGTDTFSYTVRDGSGALSSASVTVSVTGANDAPRANADTYALTEDAAATTLSVLANDTDPDSGDTRRVIAVHNTGLLGSVSIATNGTGLIYSPGQAFQHLATGQSASETFSYTMADAAGVQSSATVTVNISGSTDGPRAFNDSAAVHENAGPITINVLANDLNPENPGDQFQITGIDGAGQFASMTLILIYGVGVGQFNPGFPRMLGQAVIAPDGKSILYSPMQSLNAGEVGTDTFKYTMMGLGGQTATGIVTVSVTGANDAPTAVADTIRLSAAAVPTLINVLANDTDPDTRIDPPPPPAGELGPWDATPADVPDTKTVIGVSATGLQGSVSIAAGGNGVLYTPGGSLLALAFGQSATETFVYTMQDSAGAQSSASVTVTVQGVNHAPVAGNDSANALENGPSVSIAVLANDSDPDSAAGDTLRLAGVNAAGLQGSVTMNGANLVYAVGNAFQNLRAGATATETFAYTVADSAGALASASVSVTVTGVNDAPFAVANSYSISEDAAPSTLNVLANDTDVDAGDSKMITAVNSTGLQGSVVIAADGQSLIYTVAGAFQSLLTGQTATETFTYTMRDASGAQATAGVTVTIVGANEPVVYVNPPAPPPGALQGGSGDDTLNAGSGNDVIYGHAGDDTLNGNDGADSIFGGADRDDISGGAGNDVLSGGADADDLTGDAGADIFRYYLAAESSALNFDTIRDFASLEGDKIDLSLIDANTILAGNNDFVWAASFTGVAGELTVQASVDTVTVQGDVNGDRIADLAIELRLHGDSVPITVADFML